MPYILQNINPSGQPLQIPLPGGPALELAKGQTQGVDIRSKTLEMNKLSLSGRLAIYYVDALPQVLLPEGGQPEAPPLEELAVDAGGPRKKTKPGASEAENK